MKIISLLASPHGLKGNTAGLLHWERDWLRHGGRKRCRPRLRNAGMNFASAYMLLLHTAKRNGPTSFNTGKREREHKGFT